MTNVLIIEDEEDTRDIMKLVLTDSGFDVATAATGESGLKAIKKKVPDLIVLDILLPDITGLTLLDKLKANDKYKSIPIVVVTAVAKEIGVKEEIAKKYPEVGFVEKPFSVDSLIAAVKKKLST